jgi:hypothetical protein
MALPTEETPPRADGAMLAVGIVAKATHSPMSKRRDDEENRLTRSLAGLAAILLLAFIALFLVQRLRAVSNLQDCLMSGRTNCAPIDPSTVH